MTEPSQPQPTLTIWVDADACPVVIKETLFRAAQRAQILVMLVANQPLSIPKSLYVRRLQVMSGLDSADNEIVRRILPGDMLISSDIPLADLALAKGAAVLSFKGERFSSDTIKARLVMRDLTETLRASGIQSKGPSALNQADRKAFADQLDRWLRQQMTAGLLPVC